MSRVVIRIDATMAKACAKLAKKKDITAGEAADLLIGTAVKRRAAWAAYTAKSAKKAARKLAASRPARAAKERKVAAPKPAKKRVRKPKAAPVETAPVAAEELN